MSAGSFPSSAASSVSFGYSQMSVKMDGSFSELKAPALSFDPAHPEAANVSIEVALASIDAGYDEANAELEKDDLNGLYMRDIIREEVTPDDARLR